jgi:hypothetical protein
LHKTREKNSMEPHLLFSRTIEAHSAHLRESSVKHITFQCFCRKQHVDCKNIPHRLPSILKERHSEERLPISKQPKGITISFPDGVNANIRQTSAIGPKQVYQIL